MTVRKRYHRQGKYRYDAASGQNVQKSLRANLARSRPAYQRRDTPPGGGRNGFRENGSRAKTEASMKEKLQPIERGPGGSLSRMTATQRKRANALIRNTCCNYDNGNCLLLDDGDNCTCPQTISYSVCCIWFRRAVLPQDGALEAEIFHSGSVKRCAECGTAFVPRSNRAKYCAACAAKVHRRQKNASDKKRRWNTDK